ncbi:family 16 glycosylhydrolase [Cryomorpha ignava]|uniref:Family 16 glycosylhydrolase n=1 Tax=Cryomorpha ignava TaxID=101383 RepID=A0A7K3WM30_9FLAO|nr:family 16 glycosylhydrolase [Cryomorpha ignava]NEN22709.1 family 16 glycosylhydrolase [Cryomorpha ignava]
MKGYQNIVFFKSLILLYSWTVLTSCESPEKKSQTISKPVKEEIVITPSSFVRSTGDVEVANNKKSIILSGESTCTYQINVKEAGRYRIEFLMNSNRDSSSVWIEDYVGNKDGRTYNITGTIPVENGKEPILHFRDGSPLNKGGHTIKLQAKGAINIESIKMVLMRKHLASPETLTQEMSGENWDLVWADEFDGSGLPDTTKWTFDIGNWGWGNSELQYYTANRTENARQEDGNLIIEALKGDMGEKWTSARLTTRGKVSFLYGKIEFRAKVPPYRGNWAAGWTLGDDYVDELSWPYCGEIDILESVGYQMNDTTGNGIAHASAHCGAYYFKLGNQPTGTIDVKNMHEEFHTYAIEWSPDEIKATVDDQEYFKYDDTSTPLSWPFDKPQNLILNLTMGGGWGGAMGIDPTIYSQKMIVDYVRVYQKK